MSPSKKDVNISEKEATRKAQKKLEFEIGNLPRIGEIQDKEEKYVFPLEVRLPRIIYDEDIEQPVDVRFMSPTKVGEIEVNKKDGDISYDHLSTIRRRIRNRRDDIEEAVQKALVKSSAQEFSRLPFPEQRFSPILDILSKLILEESLYVEELDELSSKDQEKYEEYIEVLTQVNLIQRENSVIRGDEILIEIERRSDEPPEKLNAALAYFFEEGSEHIEIIRDILGPFLSISGNYYTKAIISDTLPTFAAEDFKEGLSRDYSGRNRKEKEIKLPRYLIQLEKIGLLRSEGKVPSERRWQGKEEVKSKLLRQEEELDPIAEILA